jgi:hypothetical protein
MKKLNSFLIICISLFVTTLSVFPFLGTEEFHNKIVKNWYYTLPLRILSGIFIGLIFFIPVLILNVLISKFNFKKTLEYIPLKQLFVFLFFGSLIGNIVFLLI